MHTPRTLRGVFLAMLKMSDEYASFGHNCAEASIGRLVRYSRVMSKSPAAVCHGS